SEDGSRSDLRFQPLPAVWDQVASDSNNCLGRKCDDFDKCFYFKARKQIGGAHILVVNHALFFPGLEMRRAGSNITLLPKYKVAILDEAHNLEDVAAEHMGLQITRGQVDYVLNKLLSVNRRGTEQGLLALWGNTDAIRQHRAAKNAAELFF